jgi:hypothetical protein
MPDVASLTLYTRLPRRLQRLARVSPEGRSPREGAGPPVPAPETQPQVQARRGHRDGVRILSVPDGTGGAGNDIKEVK